MKPEHHAPSPVSLSTRRRGWRLPLAVLLVLGAGGGGWMALHSKNTVAVEKPSDKKIDIYELAAVDLTTIEARELRLSLAVSGSLAPATQATVKAKVPGEIRASLVREGMKVASGQVLARLDTADLQARFATQQATLEEAQARLSMAKKNSATNQALLKQNFISQTAFDTTQNNVELVQANVKSAVSQLEIARLAMAYTVIQAPINGIVSKRHAQVGEKVSPDMPLFTIVDLSRLILEAQVPASEIPRVSAGQEVIFNVDGFAGRRFSGKVARINPATEAGSRAMLVYIEVDNADGSLRGGMFAKGSITLEKSAARPLVPLIALREENGGSVVYRIENGLVLAQKVKLGMRSEDEGLAEVTEGLSSGASILVSRLDGVKPGSKVKLATPAPALVAARKS